MNKTTNRWAERSPKTISSISQNNIKIITKALSVLLALALWEILAAVVDAKLLLVAPTDVLRRLSVLVFEPEFSETVVFTFLRIISGYFCGFSLGIILALLAGRFSLIENLLWPYMLTVKTVPVASFVVIALMWFSASSLSWLISFLMVLPIVYHNVLQGIKSVDIKMLEMATVFKMPFFRRLRYIWLPSLKPFLVSGCRISAGLAWKSGVAAELIGYPEGSIGEALYYSKLYLDTPDLFAWTVVIVILSVSFEKLFVFLVKKLLKGAETL